MSKFYRVFCDACACDYTAEIESKEHTPKYCTACGSELDENSVIDEGEDFEGSDDWETDELLRDIDDWK